MRPKLNFRFFAKFFWGVASEKEKQQVFHSQESHQMMRSHWEEGSAYPTQESLSGDLYERIQKRKTRAEKSSGPFSSRLLRLAAVLILLVGLGSITYLFVYHSRLLEPDVAYIERSNPGGQRSMIVLPDDSRLWLNASSRVRYPETFRGFKHRSIELTGEAYFEVEKHADQNFMVHTGDLSVRVKGTRFNVKAYPDEKYIETTLVEGIVVVSSASTDQEHEMTPGSKAVYSRDDQVMRIHQKANVLESIAWKDGKLIFNNDPFVEVARELERWYGVEIQLDDRLKGKHRFTMTITDESLQRVCQLLSNTTPIDYRINRDQVMFSAPE